jgi:V/A-type H+-transporting ATPase subunit I
MIPVEIIGLKSDLQVILNTLRVLGSLHIDDVSDSSQVSARKLTLDRQTLNKQEEASFLFARVEGLLNSLSIESTHTPVPIEGDLLSQVRSGMEKLAPQVQAIITQKEELQAKLSMLPRYETTLRKLLPIIPPSIHEAGNVSIGVLVSRSHLGILDSIATQVMDLTAGRAEVVASDVDASTRGMFIVIPKTYTSKVEALLGKEDVTRLRLPIELGEGPPDIALQALRNQLALMPSQISDLSRKMAGLAAEWGAQLLTWRNALREVLDTNSVVTLLGETDMTFVLVGWVPANEFDSVEKALDEKIGEALLVRQLPLTEPMKKLAPVALENPEIARPFESLVNILALPRYGHIDPTRLMAIFLPIFFGMILGDIGYGALVLGISLVLMRKYRTGVIHDILFVLTMGGGWSIVFGFLYGELFGTLGEQFGLEALWFDRASEEHVTGLLVMTIVIGAVHTILGLILGMWEGIKDRSKSHLLERGGMLLGLIGLFVIIGVLANYLPSSLMTPGIAGLIIGIVLIGASLGWLGIIMGPIEFIGLIGNILSYLRIAAIGLASVYLAKVANDMAGIVGNIVVGVILALLLHSLNLILGVFSPTIHSLRLHYVEFFRKFYEGGGRPYQPFKRQTPEGFARTAQSIQNYKTT